MKHYIFIVFAITLNLRAQDALTEPSVEPTALTVEPAAPQKFLQLQQWQMLSWQSVSNAVSYTVWWTYQDTGGHIETTKTNALVPAGVTVFVTAQDATGNDSNPSNVTTL